MKKSKKIKNEVADIAPVRVKEIEGGRRVFYIDVANVDPQSCDAMIDRMKKLFKKTKEKKSKNEKT